MYKIIILLLTILEFKISYMTFYMETLEIKSFLIIHILVTVVVFLSTQYFEKDPLLYNKLIFIIPFIGILLYLKELVFIKDNNFDIVDDVFDFEKYLAEKKNLKKIDLPKELKLISAIDTMNREDAEEKKAFIIKFKPDEIKVRVRMLRKGLRDKNIEVVHYSAVEFNQLSEKFENQLIILKKKYTTSNNELNFKRLVNFYEGYLNSDILEGEILKIHRNFYIKLLEDKLSVEENIEISIRLLKMYSVLEKYDKVIERYNVLDKLYPQNEKLYEIITILYYETNNLEMLKEMITKYQKEKVIILNNANNIFKICGLEV